MTDLPALPPSFRDVIRAALPESWQRAAEQREAEDAARAPRKNRGGGQRVPHPRHDRITIRFTADERAALAEMVGDGDVGDYVRRAVLGQRVRARVTVPPVNGAAWTALAGALSNLNQVTRLANSTHQVPSDLAPVLAALRADVVALRESLLGQDNQP